MVRYILFLIILVHLENLEAGDLMINNKELFLGLSFDDTGLITKQTITDILRLFFLLM